MGFRGDPAQLGIATGHNQRIPLLLAWVSFMTYDSIRDPINPPAIKLLPEFRRNGGRYFDTDERDFVAVYIR
ncbi:hypothetical protein [Nocardia sp. NPDC004604]|uniref:hypothetical protein n=1 Tax=Nocardia sp. NPDC004604 TaxID=3157013 RepID=UPI0033ADA0AB